MKIQEDRVIHKMMTDFHEENHKILNFDIDCKNIREDESGEMEPRGMIRIF